MVLFNLWEGFTSWIDNLTKEELIRILTEPKNSLVAQFKKIFKLDGVELNINKDALEEIAEIATKNKTGARGYEVF